MLAISAMHSMHYLHCALLFRSALASCLLAEQVALPPRLKELAASMHAEHMGLCTHLSSADCVERALACAAANCCCTQGMFCMYTHAALHAVHQRSHHLSCTVGLQHQHLQSQSH